MLEAVAFGVRLQDVHGVGDAVEQCAAQAFAGEDGGPLPGGQVVGDEGGAALAALAEDLETGLSYSRRKVGNFRLFREGSSRT